VVNEWVRHGSDLTLNAALGNLATAKANAEAGLVSAEVPKEEPTTPVVGENQPPEVLPTEEPATM